MSFLVHTCVAGPLGHCRRLTKHNIHRQTFLNPGTIFIWGLFQSKGTLSLHQLLSIFLGPFSNRCTFSTQSPYMHSLVPSRLGYPMFSTKGGWLDRSDPGPFSIRCPEKSGPLFNIKIRIRYPVVISPTRVTLVRGLCLVP